MHREIPATRSRMVPSLRCSCRCLALAPVIEPLGIPCQDNLPSFPISPKESPFLFSFSFTTTRSLFDRSSLYLHSPFSPFRFYYSLISNYASQAKTFFKRDQNLRNRLSLLIKSPLDRAEPTETSFHIKISGALIACTSTCTASAFVIFSLEIYPSIHLSIHIRNHEVLRCSPLCGHCLCSPPTRASPSSLSPQERFDKHNCLS